MEHLANRHFSLRYSASSKMFQQVTDEQKAMFRQQTVENFEAFVGAVCVLRIGT